MHQEAFPGEDISDRPPPEESVPGLLELIEGNAPSGLTAPATSSGPRRERARDRSARRGSRPTSRPRRAASPVTTCACWSRAGPTAHRPRAAFATCREFLAPGDLVVVNTSATLPAALPGTRADGERARATALDARARPRPGRVLDRRASPRRRRRSAASSVGERFELPGGATARILAPYAGVRLWLARLDLPRTARRRTSRARAADPLRLRAAALAARRRTRTSTRLEPGSAEMASAGRPFTAELITELVAGGVLVAPITLHTGVSSQERHERPYAERYRVPEQTARLVNAVHEWGGRVIAVGTTVVRALETVAAPGRDGRRRRRLDGARRHARARPPGGRRPAQRLPRVGVVASRPAERRRRRRSCSRGATRLRSSTATAGTSSATAT